MNLKIVLKEKNTVKEAVNAWKKSALASGKKQALLP